eukprot:671354_1
MCETVFSLKSLCKPLVPTTKMNFEIGALLFGGFLAVIVFCQIWCNGIPRVRPQIPIELIDSMGSSDSAHHANTRTQSHPNVKPKQIIPAPTNVLDHVNYNARPIATVHDQHMNPVEQFEWDCMRPDDDPEDEDNMSYFVQSSPSRSPTPYLDWHHKID